MNRTHWTAFWAIAYLGSCIAAQYYVIVELLGYPAVPGTTTNDYWELLWLNVEMAVVTLLTFFPVLFAVTFVFMGLAALLSALFGLLTLWRLENEQNTD